MVVLEELLEDFNTYDQYVDVVSAFEWLFTDVEEIAETVQHFERFPRIHVDGKPNPLTPDFTVVYKNGTGLVGEISKLALHENSVDKLCTQIGNYAVLGRLPVDVKGTHLSVTDLDVLQLVPADVGLPAVERIIRNRFLKTDHPYKPGKRPVIAQFSRSSDRGAYRYTFQHIPDPDNGMLPDSASPSTIGYFLTKVSNVTADRFNRIKATRKFMNDPIKPLYLATHLWQAYWPTEFGATTEDIDVEPGEIATTLKRQFGKVWFPPNRGGLGYAASRLRAAAFS